VKRSGRITDAAEIRKRIDAQGRWWHEIELAPGIVTPGDDTNQSKLPILERIGLPKDLSGRRVLDIGCSDGYFAFVCEERGADVLAIDFVPEDYTGFNTAKTILGSGVEYSMESVYNLSPDKHGCFDVVLCLGVLYHLRNPMAALDAIRSIMNTKAELFVATFMIDEHFIRADGTVGKLSDLHPELQEIPIWQAYPRGSLNGDHTNCFGPNMCALLTALREANLDPLQHEALPGAGFVRARAGSDVLAEKYQRLDQRLHKTAFDPSVPYYLDELGEVHDVTEAGKEHQRSQSKKKMGLLAKLIGR
jgi:tRNA (mo5U34)-methyltransferase